MIYCDPFPTDPVRNIAKLDAELLLSFAEEEESGFCAKLGILFTWESPDILRVEHISLERLRTKIAAAWPGGFTEQTKKSFIDLQHLHALAYLEKCRSCYAVVGLPIPLIPKNLFPMLPENIFGGG